MQFDFDGYRYELGWNPFKWKRTKVISRDEREKESYNIQRGVIEIGRTLRQKLGELETDVTIYKEE
jgi:hypothetical protein